MTVPCKLKTNIFMLTPQNCHIFFLFSEGVGYIIMNQSDNHGQTVTQPNLVLVMCLIYLIEVTMSFSIFFFKTYLLPGAW